MNSLRERAMSIGGDFTRRLLRTSGKAIDGHASNLGNKSEYRFHYLRGIIKIGSFKNNSPSIVSLPEAEQSFTQAARYARHDLPKEAANALLFASRSANLQGKYDQAAKYAREGLGYAHFAGLYYELAKSLINLGLAEEAKSNSRAPSDWTRTF